MKTLRRSLFLLLALLVLAPGAWAQLPDFITDVLVIGHNDQTYLQVYETIYTEQGYTAIHYNLNAGCTSGDFIHLLYKKQSSLNSSGSPITGFYIKTGSNPPDSLTHEGRTYHLVPCNGSTNFVNSKGDLNRGAGGAYIYLYYTKDPMTVECSVTGITFNATQSGGVGANGDNTTGYDLNSGAGGDYIYMHVATNKIPITLTAESEEVQLEDGDILTGTGGADTRVTIAAGATVTLAGVTITDIPDDNDHQWAGIGCLGDAVVILADGTTNTVKGGRRYPSIHVPVGQTLTIEGGGTLNASGSHAAGLGGGYFVSCGNINITGGIVNATGDEYSAGIGSGYVTGNGIGGIYSDSNCGNITISGGTVTATGGNRGAGIGSGTSNSELYHSVCGDITISGGTVTATGGNNAAGIGGGMRGSNFGTITITNGVNRVTAIKGEDNNYSIGPGRYGNFSTIVIGDVVTDRIEQSPFVTYPYTISFDANGGSGTMDDMHLMNDVAQYLTPNSFTNEGLWFFGWATTPDGEIVYSNGHSVSHMTETSGGTVTLYAKWSTASIVSLTPQTGDLQLQDGDILIGTGGPDTRLTIADGATVTFAGVHITSIPNNSSYQWAAVTCLGDATIILDQTNEVVGGYYSPGITVAPDKTLTLQGLGTLNATGRHGSAGIGSSDSNPCGNIVIQSGNINAAGTASGAGIGGCCGNITISGGTVNAIGGGSGVGIGSGDSSDEVCGDITISGGTVNATGGYGAGIGSGGFGACGDIIITNDVTRVTAIKGQNCSSSIGSGNFSACGTITIGGVETGNITQSPFVTFPYTVGFDANGGSGTMSDQSFMYNVAQNLSANSFTNGSLCHFGWATSANGPKVYDNGQSVSNLADTIATVTLYAKWRLFHVMLTSSTGEVLLQDGDTLTGTGGPDTHITIADGATVTLSGVDITSIANDESHPWAGITCLGNAVIVLDEGTTNNITGGYRRPGLYVPASKTLTLQGNGTLNGTLNATGRLYAAGIGGGYQSSCGNITIANSIGSLTATAGPSCDNAIGAGNGSSCGTITIGDVVTGNITQSPFTTFPYTVSFDANGGTGTMNDQVFMYNVAQDLSTNSFTWADHLFDGWATSSNGPKVYDNAQSVINLTETSGATVTLYAAWTSTLVTLTSSSGEVQLKNGNVLTGTGGPDTHVTIADGATVTLSGVDITSIANDESHPWAGITCLGDAVIVLDEGTTNNITGGYRSSGLYVPEGKTLTIQGNGTLNATGRDYAAGIGGGYQSSCGNLTIANSIGSLTATAGPSCDNAIGAGYGTSCGTITIGDVVTGNITQSPFVTFPYTVAFDANGGTGTMNDQVFMYNVAQNLNANSFTRTNYRFDGWATSPNGPMVYENTQSVINLTQTPGATVTLYATWMPAAIVTLAFQSTDVALTDGAVLTGEGGRDTHVTIADGATVVLSGVNITSISDHSGHHWAGITCLGDAVIILQTGTTNSVRGGYRSPGLYVPEGKTLTIQGNGTLNATGRYYAAGIGGGHQSSCGNITIANSIGSLTATAGPSCGNAIGAGYGSSCGTVTIGGVVTGNISQSPFVTFPYTVSFNPNGGTGTMSNQSFMYNVAQNLHANGFSNGSLSFEGWATSANGPIVYDNEQNVNNLAGTSGATVPLYAKWSELTFTLDVEGYGDASNPGGWYLVASPVTQAIAPSADNGFLTSEYDLYYFDHDYPGAQWRNYETDNFLLNNGTGYLYASEGATTLTFTGTPYNGSGEIELAYNPDVPDFSGWNLVGNPFAETASVDRDFYVMNGERSEVIAAEGSTVGAMEGLFVVAEGADETVTFTKNNTRETRPEERIVINLGSTAGVSTGSTTAVIDRAIVRFGAGKSLPKFQLDPSHTKVYLPMDGKDYAIVQADEAGVMPVHFKAENNGSYTITVKPENVDLAYLHLIDHLTGADIDLLSPSLTPSNAEHLRAERSNPEQAVSYSFTAKTTDYESRFELVYSAGGPSTGSGTDQPFAFCANGDWIILNPSTSSGTATLQIFDMHGRQIYTREAIQHSSFSIPHSSFRIDSVEYFVFPHSAFPTPGVYVLRLMDGESVRVQKIVIE